MQKDEYIIPLLGKFGLLMVCSIVVVSIIVWRKILTEWFGFTDIDMRV